MKKPTLEQKRMLMLGTLFIVLGFNLSIHFFEKDENGFAKLDYQMRYDHPKQDSQRFVVQQDSGVIDFAQTVTPDADKDKATKAEDKEADLKKKVKEELVEFKNKKPTQVIFVKAGGQTSAVFVDPDCDCNKQYFLNEKFEDLSKVKEALIESVAKDAEKEKTTEVTKKSKEKEDDVDEGDDDADSTAPKKTAAEKAKAKKEKLAAKLKLERKDAFEKILDNCKTHSEPIDEVDCRTRGLLDLVKDKKVVNRNESDLKEDELNVQSCKDFYKESIELALQAAMADDESLVLSPARLQITKNLIGRLPKSLNGLRADIMRNDLNMVGQVAERYQEAEFLKVRRAAQLRQSYGNNFDVMSDEIFQNLNYESMQLHDAARMTSSQYGQATGLGLNMAYRSQLISPLEYRNTTSLYQRNLLQVNNRILHPERGYGVYGNSRTARYTDEYYQGGFGGSDYMSRDYGSSLYRDGYSRKYADPLMLIDPLYDSNYDTPGLSYLNAQQNRTRIIDRNSALAIRPGNGTTATNGATVLTPLQTTTTSTPSVFNTGNSGATTRQANTGFLSGQSGQTFQNSGQQQYNYPNQLQNQIPVGDSGRNGFFAH